MFNQLFIHKTIIFVQFLAALSIKLIDDQLHANSSRNSAIFNTSVRSPLWHFVFPQPILVNTERIAR